MQNKIARKQINSLPNGILYLKGGDLHEETKPNKNLVYVKNLSDWLDKEFFEMMKAVHLPVLQLFLVIGSF